jgi:hypothetical protein
MIAWRYFRSRIRTQRQCANLLAYDSHKSDDELLYRKLANWVLEFDFMFNGWRKLIRTCAGHADAQRY